MAVQRNMNTMSDSHTPSPYTVGSGGSDRDGYHVGLTPHVTTLPNPGCDKWLWRDHREGRQYKACRTCQFVASVQTRSRRSISYKSTDLRQQTADRRSNVISIGYAVNYCIDLTGMIDSCVPLAVSGGGHTQRKCPWPQVRQTRCKAQVQATTTSKCTARIRRAPQ